PGFGPNAVTSRRDPRGAAAAGEADGMAPTIKIGSRPRSASSSPRIVTLRRTDRTLSSEVEGKTMQLPRRAFLRLGGGAAGAAGLARAGQTLAGGTFAAGPPAPLAPQASPTPPPSFPNPGRVTGDTKVHDPSLVRASNGTYILTHTGNNLSIKTSTDRV